MEIQLKKFDMNKITSDKVVVLIGKRNTGKSIIVRDILYKHKTIPVGQVISGTETANQFYTKIVPKIFIHEEYNPSIIGNILKRQKLMLDQGMNNSIDPRVFLILDDCLFDNTWTKTPDIRSIFMNGRHFKILFILTMQYALGIPPNLRTNIDYVFILRENLVNNRKRIYENYAGMFPNFETFCQVMDQCTENYECLVIHNNAKSNKIEDQVFWYKAETHPAFKIGAEEYWQTHNNNFDGESDEDEDVFDLAQIRRRKGPIVNVKKISN